MAILVSLITLILCVGQFVVSPNPPLLYQTENDLIAQNQRMNDYPPQYFRLANLLEQRAESRLFFKLQDNFFKLLNLHLFPVLLLPLLILGFFNLIKAHHYHYLLTILVVPVITLTFLGPNLIHGNFSLYPFLVISALYGFVSLLKK